MAEVIGIAVGEIWVPAPGFQKYQVSTLGRVRRISGACGTHVGRILKPASTHGYLFVTLRDDENRSRTTRIHHLVCIAFHGPRPSERHHAAHNNGDKSDNRMVNLRWATPEENQMDRVLHGTDLRGSEVFGAVLTEDQIPLIRERLKSTSGIEVAKEFGVSPSTISLINRDRIWRHA